MRITKSRNFVLLSWHPAMAKYADLLKNVSLFCGLSAQQINSLEPLLNFKSFPKEAVIVHREDKSRRLFVIYKGRVKSVMYGDNGREITLNWYGPGDFFGELL